MILTNTVHSIVNSQARFIGKTRDLAAWQRVDTDSFTVAIRVFAERASVWIKGMDGRVQRWGTGSWVGRQHFVGIGGRFAPW